MRNKLLLLVVFVFFNSFGQNALWNKVSEEATKSSIKMERASIPTKFELYSLNLELLKSQLQQAPLDSQNTTSNVIIAFPNPKGELEDYRIYESPIMEQGLANKFPNLKTYTGKSIQNPAETIRFSITLFGLHVMSLSGENGTYYIDTYTKDLKNYIVYKRQDVTASKSFQCGVADTTSEVVKSVENTIQNRVSDGFFRTYRLAMACTIEYAAFHVTAAGLGAGTLAQKKAAVLSAMVVTMARVNGVFENDMSFRMNLIANNDLIIFVDSDSFDNSNTANALLNQSQTVIDATIGSANYDIGHTVSTGGGGVAQLFSPCTANKARGITGLGSPVGDPFNIDYVAHEMGHQWGGNHTQNNACQRNATTAVEPGSASTIMGYAGICAPNVQSNSDAYFHTVSISEMTNFISGTGGTCAVAVNYGNVAPIANAGIDYTIPKGTAFILKGTGSDANGDVLTYCWEQINNEVSTQAPTQTATTGPNFRSISPTTSPNRYMPPLASVVANILNPTWEVVPTVARTMNFAMTIRDNRTPNGGQTKRDDMMLTVANVGPFLVSSPNTAVSYVGNSTQTMTWDVAGTTANGINCANVDIYLSTNGGLTFPILLQLGTPNDGTQAINIPNLPGATNRIMIAGSNHIFYDVSNTNFTITAGTPETTLPTAPTLTASGTTSTSTVLSWSGAFDNVAVTGYNIYRNAVLIGSSISSPYTATGLTASTTYTFTVRAKDADNNLSVPSNAVNVTTLTPDTTPPSAPVLSASGTTSTSTNLSWTVATDNIAVTGYEVYRNSILIGSTTTATTFNVTGLTASTAYAFNVKAKDAAGNLSVNSNTVNVTTLAPDTTPPSAPTLSACGTTSTSTVLSWSGATDNIAVTGYDIYQGATLIGSVATSPTTITGLTPLTAYTFKIRAKDAANNISVDSNIVSITTMQFTYCTSQGNSIADESIGNVQLGTINNSSTGGTGYTNFNCISTNLVLGSTNTITITPFWTSTVFNEAYAVFIDYNRDGDYIDAGETVYTRTATTATPISGSFTVPNNVLFIGSTSMRVSMKYYGAAGSVSPTACETFDFGQVEDYTVNIVTDTIPPSAPVLSASGTTITTTNLSWTVATDNIAVTGYEVYRNAVLIGTTTTATTFNVTGLSPATLYTFTVKSKDAIGNLSLSSNAVNVTTLADTIPPSAPVLSASGTTITTTNLSWTVATDNIAVTGYEVYRNAVLIGITTTATTFNVTGLSPATLYNFTVKSKDAAGNLSVNRNPKKVKTLNYKIPPYPPLLSPSATTITTTNLSWTVATDNIAVTGYEVYRNAVLIGTTTTATTFNVTGLSPATLYTFTVKSKDAAGNLSVNSNAVNVTTLADTIPPSAPVLSASGTTITTTNLSWTVATDNIAVTGYEVYRNAVLIGTTTTATTFNVTGLSPATLYTFTVKSKDAAGNLSVNSNSVNVTTLSNTTVVSTKFFMEGYYDSAPVLPAMVPVRANQGIGVSTTDVDDVTVELRNGVTPFAIIATTTAMLQTSGIATATFNSAISGSYYLVIKHRNTIQTWSANPITISAVTPTYDFTDIASKAYGSNMKEVESGVWAFYSGDITQDEVTDASDLVDISADIENSSFGYLATDINGDGSVDGSDLPILSTNIDNSVFSANPFN